MGRLALVVLLLVGTTASAQPNKPEGARLFEEGRALASEGKFEEACARFQRSLELDRAPGTALNYGDCLENLGQLRKAWHMYDEAARDFERDRDARARFARERADAVAARLAIVVLKIAEPTIDGLVIKIGTQSVPPAAEIRERIEPGEIDITVTAPGREPFTSSARGISGAQVIVEVPVLATILGAPRPAPAPAEDGRRSRSRVRLAGIVTGAGGVFLIGSVALGLSARAVYADADCMDTAMGLVCSAAGAAEVDTAGTRADIATGLAIAGGLGVVGGVVLYLTAPRERLSVAPTMTSGSVGLAVRGRF